MTFSVLQIFLILTLPYLLTISTERLGTQNLLSPVILCYLAGIGLRNLTPLPLDDGVSNHFSQAAVVLAIPLLLYSTDLPAWLKLAKSTLLSFGLIIISVLISSATMAWAFDGLLQNTWLMGGMLAGVFIGTTANMNAVGIALEASDETFIILNAADIACGGLYLIFLTSVAPIVFGLLLKEFDGDKHAGADEFLPKNGFTWKDIIKAFGLTILLVCVSIGIVWLAVGSLEKPGLIILLISSLGVGASFIPAVRRLKGSYETGEYLLLMFCVAIGMMADFREIFTSGGMVMALTACILSMSVFLHLVLCRIFKIDRDTMMITSTAAIYGPPFIGQVAAVLKNRAMVFSGIATGLVGIAVANFFGVLLGNLLRVWLE